MQILSMQNTRKRSFGDRMLDSLYAFLILGLIGDIIHKADGHQCTNECPYPWGKKGPFSKALDNEN